ncbi:hypothetical protein H9Q13_02935 [Pontibacter sp. JH31]|uniref:SpoIIAA-like n=1 Tax=Pontibacter aquaedesilientis TaxID=2766980 RepID=A0ABR7XCT6_9BACT|nr:hypothetical protein [Pontibacter aquaedesilientis]MBD1396109.1 hypothetical protein [Pontibacter aquaedesilientis]
MIIYKNSYCTLSYLSADHTILLKWLRQPTFKILLEIYDVGIDLAMNYRVTNWIADNSIGIHFDVSMQRALAELCARRLAKTDISRFARVVPPDVFQELVSHKMIHMVSQLCHHTIAFELFTELEDAQKWAVAQDRTQAYA